MQPTGQRQRLCELVSAQPARGTHHRKLRPRGHVSGVSRQRVSEVIRVRARWNSRSLEDE